MIGVGFNVTSTLAPVATHTHTHAHGGGSQLPPPDDEMTSNDLFE